MNKSSNLDGTVFQNDWHTIVDVLNNSEKPKSINGYENTLMRKELDEHSETIIIDDDLSQTDVTDNMKSSISYASTTDRFKSFENSIKRTSSTCDLRNRSGMDKNIPPIPGPKPEHLKAELDNFGRPIPGPKPSLNRASRQRAGYTHSLLGLLSARCVFEPRDLHRPIIVDECRKSLPKSTEPTSSAPKIIDVVYKMNDDIKKQPENKYKKYDNLFQLTKTINKNEDQTPMNVREKIEFFNNLASFKCTIRQSKTLDIQLNKSVGEIKTQLKNIAKSKSTNELRTKNNNYKSIDSFRDITLDSSLLDSSELDRRFNQLYIESKSTNTIDKIDNQIDTVISRNKCISNPDILISQISNLDLSIEEDTVNITSTKSRLKETLLSTLFDQFETMILAGCYLKNLQTPLKFISNFTERTIKANDSEHLKNFIHNLCTACDFGFTTWTEYSNDMNEYHAIPLAISELLSSSSPIANINQDIIDDTLLSEDYILELLFEHFETVRAIRDFLKTLENLFKSIWLSIEHRFSGFINSTKCEDFIDRLCKAAEAGYNNCAEYCSDIIYLSTIYPNEKNSFKNISASDENQLQFQNSLKNLERPDLFRNYGNLQELDKNEEEDGANKSVDISFSSILSEEDFCVISNHVENSSCTSTSASTKPSFMAEDNIDINSNLAIAMPETPTNRTFILPTCNFAPELKNDQESKTGTTPEVSILETPSQQNTSINTSTPKLKNCVKRISSAIFDYVKKKKSKIGYAKLDNKKDD